jgi:phage tail-like protein
MPPPTDPFLNNHFRVEIDGVATSDFTEVILPEPRADIIEFRTGGERTTRKIAGRVRYSNLVLRRGLSQSDELFQWWSLVVSGVPARKNASVVLLGSSLEEVKRWNLFRLLPARYTLSPLSTIEAPVALMETLECATEDLNASHRVQMVSRRAV